MKHTFLRFLSVLFVLTLTLTHVYAERISPEEAAVVAQNFMNADTAQAGVSKPAGRRMALKKSATETSEQPQYYIYEYSDGGWVIVAANDAVRPIIAYSKTGFFRTDNQPKNVQVWMQGREKQIKYAEENNIEATEEVAEEWKQLRKAPPVTASGNVVVAPLIKTTWDQTSPYWNQCPKKGSTNTYTGCVATAMAQVMNYWQWPVTGTGSYSYTSETNSLSCSANFGETTYDWSNMVDHYTAYYTGPNTNSVPSTTTAQKNAVATLMYHCGVAAGMDYGTSSQGGSSAYTIYPNKSYTTTRCAAYALIHNFGYNSSTLKCYYRSGGYGYSSVSEANWLNLLKTELNANRPIMYAGADSQGAHSFVCDGYDDQNYFHFNWGWSGYCDGYYTVNNMVTSTGGSGAGNGSYNDSQDIIIGIQPPVTGHNIVTNGTGCTITPDKARVENGNSVTATITPTDATYDFTSITVKLGTTTLTQTTHYTLSTDKKTLTIKASAITGDVSNDLTITVVWTKNRYSYEMLGENCTEELSGMVNKNTALNLTITPSSGYTLANAACWDVTMDGTALTYGSGFTYSGNTFTISSVTGDVEILAYGSRPVTWSANGSTHATNLAISDKLTLPADPADCSGAGGKKFVGWTASSSVSGNTAPTFVKDGDDYSAATYYAVYATASGSGGDPTTIVERMSNSSPNVALTGWTASAGGTYTSAGNYGESSPSIKFSSTGHYVQSALVGSAITEVSYWYKPQNATGSLAFYVSTDGSTFTELTAERVSFSNSSTSGTKSITLSASSGYKAIKIVYTKTTSNVAVDDVSLTYGSGSSYSDYSLTCGTPCSNTPVMSFTNETVNKTTNDASYTQAVTISGKGSGQTVAYNSNDETIATVNSSGVVTLKGKVGSTTITASVEANGTYCAASASYTLNVTAAPINVTLYYNGTSAVLNNQPAPYTLPTTSPYNTAMCSGDWTFAGWYGSAYAKSETAPTYITELTVTGSAYAVYTMTESSGGASGASVGTTMWSENWTGVENNKTPTSPSASGSSVYGSATVTYAWTNGGSTSQTYTTGGPNNNENILVSKTNGKFTANGIPTGGATELAVTYATSGSGSITVSSTTTNVSVSDGTITISDAGVTNFSLEFKNTSGSNVRLDDILVRVKTSGSGGGSSTTHYATSPDCSATIDHTVTWKACGETFHTQGFADGAALVLPSSTPADNAGKTFVGWTATEHHTGALEPADLFTTAGSKTVTADVTYYAVFH